MKFAIPFAVLIQFVYILYCYIGDRVYGYKDTDLAFLKPFKRLPPRSNPRLQLLSVIMQCSTRRLKNYITILYLHFLIFISIYVKIVISFKL